MSYKALLFCPEASSARVIGQALSELDFECEPCGEPFAAVKRLTSERLDATVIDCSNEQDAALLVKSARNSSFNQQALFVAIVDGKNGVASAFRLGANLVLTKPVSLEQAKITLRMARGLLHKSEVAKAAAAAAQSSSASEPAAVMHAPAMPAPAMPKPPVVPPASWEPASEVAAPPASILEVEAEPAPVLEPAEAGVLESVPEPTSSKSAPSAWPAAAAQKSVWEKVSQSVTPMASTLLEAEEAVREDEPEAMPAESPSSPALADGLPARPLPAHSVDAGGESAQGAAAARARIPAAETSSSAAKAKAAPAQSYVPATLSKLAEQQPESNTVKWLAVVLLVLALAALGYMGWTKLHPSSAAPSATTPANSVPSTRATPPASEPAPAPLLEAGTSQPGLKSTSAQSATVPTPGKQTESASRSATTTAASAPPARTPAPQEVLLVSSQPAAASSPPNPPAEPVPDAPAPDQAAYGSQNQAISSLVYTSSNNASTPTLVNNRISQGVAQGLLIKSVQPVYPAQALAMHLQGAVQLLATISKDGNVTNLKQVGGDAVLGHAAMDAVKQWKYKPYLLNGEPLEIQTEITVNFKAP